MKDDITRTEAQREHERQEWERHKKAWEARIIGSPVELEHVIYHSTYETQMRVMRLIADLTDAGLTLQGMHHHNLEEQTLDMVEELAHWVKQAIEEYISE